MDAITLVTNSEAGSSDDAAVQAVLGVLRDAASVEVVAADDEDGIDARLGEGRQIVVVAGGDGSVHATVGALHRRGRLGDCVLGLVPLGTGNDFARTLGLPIGDAAAAAGVVLEQVRRPLDLLVDDAGGVVVNAVHLGVGAEAGRRAGPWKQRLGKVGYLVGSLLAGVRAKGDRIRVVADDTVLADGRRRVLQVAIGNGRFVGGGTPLLPDADPGDGAADVLVSFATAPLERLRYALRLRRGRQQELPGVVIVRARRVDVSGPDLWLNADGELAGPLPHRRWTVEPGVLTMLVPAPAIASRPPGIGAQ